VAGAPNVLKGGSHSGNLSATEAVLDGSVDILCSDYYPAALLHAVFLLHRRWDVGLPAAVRLVTLNPAKAVLVDHNVGSLAPGKRADILIVDTLGDGFPVVSRALVDGRTVFESRYRRSTA
jgi:alpha-D-ribose 1-methylphosphonate 5-triphosphate diphosphatase